MNCLFCHDTEIVRNNPKARRCPTCKTRYHFTSKAINVLTSYHMNVDLDGKHYVAHFYTDYLVKIKEPNYYTDREFILSYIPEDEPAVNVFKLPKRPNWTPSNIHDKLKLILPFL